MDAGKPRKQSLAIALDVQRRNKRKKMASGGPVAESASNERRPMPDQSAADSAMVSRNSGKKALPQDQWTDSPTVAQAQRQPVQKLSRPKIVGSDAFSVRDMSRIHDEEHLDSSDRPDGIGRQPSSMDNEAGADRQGPSVPALKMKRMAEGGMLPPGSEDDMAEHPAGLEQDDDQMRPPMDEYMDGKMAEGGQVEEPSAWDNIKSNLTTGKSAENKSWGKYAEGGMIDLDEVAEDKHASIAAAIMAKRDRMRGGSDSDIDKMEMMAEGGMVDLSRNADEDANLEDQLSFDALKKENYSESEGLDDLGDQPHDSNLKGDSREMDAENKHDRIAYMRSKMRAKRQP